MLYKYLYRKHASQLLNMGLVLLGTLYDFRRTEQHGEIIGDKDEGTRTYELSGPMTVTPENQPEILKQNFNLKEGSSLKFLGDASFTQNSLDHYLFCMTTRLDRRLMEEFGYDTCVRIDNPSEFFGALSNCFATGTRFVGIYECIYAERTRPHERFGKDDQHPALLKDTKDWEQKEVRAVWEVPEGRIIEPTFVICQNLIRYCSEVAVPCDASSPKAAETEFP